MEMEWRSGGKTGRRGTRLSAARAADRKIPVGSDEDGGRSRGAAAAEARSNADGNAPRPGNLTPGAAVWEAPTRARLPPSAMADTPRWPPVPPGCARRAPGRRRAWPPRSWKPSLLPAAVRLSPCGRGNRDARRQKSWRSRLATIRFAQTPPASSPRRPIAAQPNVRRESARQRSKRRIWRCAGTSEGVITREAPGKASGKGFAAAGEGVWLKRCQQANGAGRGATVGRLCQTAGGRLCTDAPHSLCPLLHRPEMLAHPGACC